MTLVIIFFTTLVATFLSSMSGGGASIINLPVFLSLGMPFPLAVSVQKMSSAFWVLPAAYNYLRDRKIDWKFLIIFSVIGLLGAYFGVLVVLQVNHRILEIIIGILILLLVSYTFFKKDIGLREKRIYSKSREFIAYVGAILLGFYESIFGSGNGIAFAFLTLHTKGFDFIDALGYYFSVAFLWVLFAAGLLIHKGYFNVPFMIVATIGSVTGAYLGSRLAKYKGNKFIKTIFVIIGTLLGVKLILGI